MSDMRLKGACPGRWCGCLACSERRAELGQPPLVLRIGRHRIQALPPEDADEGDGLDCARGLGAALTILFGFWCGALVAIAWLCS